MPCKLFLSKKQRCKASAATYKTAHCSGCHWRRSIWLHFWIYSLHCWLKQQNVWSSFNCQKFGVNLLSVLHRRYKECVMCPSSGGDKSRGWDQWMIFHGWGYWFEFPSWLWHRCLDNVWQRGHLTCKKPVPFISKVLFRNTWNNKVKGQPAIRGLLGKWSLARVCVCFPASSTTSGSILMASLQVYLVS